MAKVRKGFAAISLARRREIAAMGGKAAHAQGRAHRWTVEEAQIAGRKGGLASRGGGRPATVGTHAAIKAVVEAPLNNMPRENIVTADIMDAGDSLDGVGR